MCSPRVPLISFDSLQGICTIGFCVADSNFICAGKVEPSNGRILCAPRLLRSAAETPLWRRLGSTLPCAQKLDEEWQEELVRDPKSREEAGEARSVAAKDDEDNAAFQLVKSNTFLVFKPEGKTLKERPARYDGAFQDGGRRGPRGRTAAAETC